MIGKLVNRLYIYCFLFVTAVLALSLIYCLRKRFLACLLLFFRIHLTFLSFHWTKLLLAALKATGVGGPELK